jgi:hypothetical protein
VGLNSSGELVNVTSIALGSIGSPSYPLDVGGNARVSGTMTMGTLIATSSATIDGNFTATGSGTINGNFTATGSGTINGNFTATGSATLAAGLLKLESLNNAGAGATTYSAAAGTFFNAYKTTTGSVLQYLDIVADGASSTSISGIIRFLTRPNTSTTSTPIERVRIDNAGNVGIGTTTPGATLAVAGSGAFSGALAVSGAGTISSTLTVTGSTAVQTFSATTASLSGTLYSTSTLSAHTGIRVAAGGDLPMGTYTASSAGAP